MTIKQLNKQNPQKYVISDGLFFIGPLKNFRHTVTEKREDAEVWSYTDTISPYKLDMARIETGLKELQFIAL